MEEIATGQMRYDMLVFNLILEFLHVHTSRSVVVCIRNVCMLTYVMIVYLIAGEMEMFRASVSTHVGKQASWKQASWTRCTCTFVTLTYNVPENAHMHMGETQCSLLATVLIFVYIHAYISIG